MTVRAAWLTPTGQTREDTRIALSALLTPNGQLDANIPLKSRGGVVPGGLTLTAVSAMQCSIGTGRAVIQGDTNQGAYMVAVTVPESLTLADGDPQLDRIDLIELVVLDDAYDGSGKTEALVRLVKGTPAAVPVAPATPSGTAIPLYSIKVKAGTSAGNGGVTWSEAVSLRYPTVALGGIVPADGFKGAYVGQYRDAGGKFQRWDGATWVSYAPEVGGIAPAGKLTTGTYVGQYRDGAAGVLQRWDGTTWQYAEGRTAVLFSASQTAMQSIPSSSTSGWYAVTLQTVDIDDLTGWNGNDTYTVPRTGWWRVSGQVVFSADSTTGSRGARLMVAGAGIPRATWLVGAGPGATAVGGQALVKLTAGQTLQLHAHQNSGAAVRTFGGSGYACSLAAEWIRS
ncbi:hypothetical protein OG625_15630 [Streptomyces sp. NBC_01351]|uniref:hypothetical protein n=1 Tax=Streptomyces sp. NBC_01351 TaxID=2903833 RepID=UPI002E354E1F|nr:hypothetical protein [Streptomyces sp. NBC_01351]